MAREEQAGNCAYAPGKSYVLDGDALDVAKLVLEKEDGPVCIVTALTNAKELLRRGTHEYVNAHVHTAVELRSLAERGDFLPKALVLENYQLLEDLDLVAKVAEAARMMEPSPQIVVVGDERIKPAADLIGGEYSVARISRVKAAYFVPAKNVTEEFMAVFSLTKIKPVRNVCIVHATERDLRRVQVFLSAFGVPAEKIEARPAGESVKVGLATPDNLIIHRYALIIDLSRKVRSQETAVLYAGKEPPAGVTLRDSGKFLVLLEKAVPYKYRIESVLGMITKDVLSGRRDIEPSRVRHLQGALRLLK